MPFNASDNENTGVYGNNRTWFEQQLLPSEVRSRYRRRIWKGIILMWVLVIITHIVPVLLERNADGRIEIKSVGAQQLFRVGADELRIRVLRITPLILIVANPVLLWMQFRKAPRIIQFGLVGFFWIAGYLAVGVTIITLGVWISYFLLQQALLGITCSIGLFGGIYLWARRYVRTRTNQNPARQTKEHDQVSPATWIETFAAGCMVTISLLYYSLMS